MDTSKETPQNHPVLKIPQAEAAELGWKQPGIAPSINTARRMGATTLAFGAVEYGDMHTGQPTIGGHQAKTLK